MAYNCPLHCPDRVAHQITHQARCELKFLAQGGWGFLAHRSEPGEDYQPGVFRCPCGLFADANPTGTTTLHPNQPIAVDRQTAFQNVETARLNQVQQALQLVEADAFEDEDEEDYDDEMIPRIYDMNELYGTPCIDSHECKFPVQHTLMDRLMIYLLKSLKMTDHSPFHMTWSEYVLGLGPFEQDSIAIEATRSQLANAFREELVETVLPTQPDRYISINYEVLVDFRDEPLFEVELIPRNVNIGSIAKMMVSTIRCAELVIQGTIPEVEAEIRPIVEL